MIGQDRPHSLRGARNDGALLQRGSVCPREMEGTGRVGMGVRIVGGKVVQEGWRASLCSLALLQSK